MILHSDVDVDVDVGVDVDVDVEIYQQSVGTDPRVGPFIRLALRLKYGEV